MNISRIVPSLGSDPLFELTLASTSRRGNSPNGNNEGLPVRTRDFNLASRSSPNRYVTPAVPFCHLTFSVLRPLLHRYERVKVPEGTLGAAFRARRRTLGLEQREVAGKLGVSSGTYRSWEVNRSKPALKHLPRAIAFLGYDWRARSNSFAESLRLKRTRLGWSLRDLARRAGVDWTTIRAWERDQHRPTSGALAAVEEALAGGVRSTYGPARPPRHRNWETNRRVSNPRSREGVERWLSS